MMRALWLLALIITIFYVSCSWAQNCTGVESLRVTNYDVLDAASDNCTRFPTAVPRALWIPGVSEFLRIDLTQPHLFQVLPFLNGSISSAVLVARVVDNSTSPEIAFDFVAQFTNFQGRCNASSLNLELTPQCYLNLSAPCFQCFGNWNGTLVSVEGSAFPDAVIHLTGRTGHPSAQTGPGANGKNVDFGLSAWCDWHVGRDCRSGTRRLSYVRSRICDLNIDLFSPPPPSVSGDPHFIGFRGQRFDFHGEADSVFNLVSDTSLQLNARFANADLRPKKIHKTYISDLGLLMAGHKLQFGCNRGETDHIIEFDGQPMIPGQAYTLGEKQSLVLRDESDKITVDFHPYLIRAWFSRSTHSSCHITLRTTYQMGTTATLPHGVLGQTASSDVLGAVLVNGAKPLQGEGTIEGNWQDYKLDSNNLFGSDFKFNRFEDGMDGEPELDEEDYQTLAAASF